MPEVARVREIKVSVGGDDRAWRPGWEATCDLCSWTHDAVGKSLAVEAAIAHWFKAHTKP